VDVDRKAAAPGRRLLQTRRAAINRYRLPASPQQQTSRTLLQRSIDGTDGLKTVS